MSSQEKPGLREVVHVKAKLGTSGDVENYKKFAVDPHITNYSVFLGILSKCFNILTDFTVSYLAADDYGEQFYLPLQSDWDLDAAILTSSSPSLRIKVNVKKMSPDLTDWDIVVPADVRVHARGLQVANQSPLPVASAKRLSTQTSSVFSNFSRSFTRTVANVQRAIGMRTDTGSDVLLQKLPMSDAEFRQYLDSVGHMSHSHQFYWNVYRGGLEPNLRKVSWRLLLSVFPAETTGQERISLLESKTSQYVAMKQSWKSAYIQGRLTEGQLATLASVSIDVVRTDWTNEFYMGDQNRHRVCQLFDLLATYCIYHPNTGYNQGMSDLASPLLVVQGDEAAAYMCFCALMQRVKINFSASSQFGLIAKMRQLHDLLVYTDPHLARFLQMHGLADMYFTQRWLMLELKREFQFNDCLLLFEVQWATVALIRSLCEPDGRTGSSNVTSGGYLVLADQSPVFEPCDDSVTDEVNPLLFLSRYRARDVSLINSLIGSPYVVRLTNAPPATNLHARPSSLAETAQNPSPLRTSQPVSTAKENMNLNNSRRDSDPFKGANLDEEASTSLANRQRAYRIDNVPTAGSLMLSSNYSSMRPLRAVIRLPPPDQLGQGNPFLLFLCLALLLEYRDSLLALVNEPSDLIAFYQHRSRQHNVQRVLTRARHLFDRYLAEQNWSALPGPASRGFLKHQ